MRHRIRGKDNQQGVASIFVVMTLMTVLALISIGFSHLMNREVRQSLDRQLSIAAQYASESGINDATAYEKAIGNKIDNCQLPADGSDYFVDGGVISGDGLVKYSCIITNPTPKQLTLDIPAGQSKVIRLTGGSSNSLSTLQKIYFGWQNSGTGTDTPQPLGVYGQNPKLGDVVENATGLLRVGLYPLVGGCSDVDTHGDRNANYSLITDSTNAALECASRNYFMYPSAGSGAAPNCAYSNLSNSNGCVDYTRLIDDGGVVPGNCTTPIKAPITDYQNQATPTYCNTVINNLLPVSGAGAAGYYIRLTAVYESLRVFIQAADATVPTPKALPVSDAQASIDATGTGNDILRRIRVMAPLQDDVYPLNYGLQSMESVCKLFRQPVPAPGQYGQAVLDGAASQYNSDNNCTFPSGSTYIDPGSIPPFGNYPLPQVSLSASPNNFDAGGSNVITLTWSSRYADYCAAAGGPWSGSSLTPSGSKNSDSAVSSTTTFTVSCTGPSGTTNAQATVTVNQPPPPPPPNCNDHGGYVSGGSSGWHAEITGNNPCGVGIVQCAIFDAAGGFVEARYYGDPTSLDDSSGVVGGRVTCQDIQGNWY